MDRLSVILGTREAEEVCSAGFLGEVVLGSYRRGARKRACGKGLPGRGTDSLGEDLRTELAWHLGQCQACVWVSPGGLVLGAYHG